jgi:hypothetical protein
MHATIDRGRRTWRLFVLGISVVLLVALWIYSLSLDQWGDTRAVIFACRWLVHDLLQGKASAG